MLRRLALLLLLLGTGWLGCSQSQEDAHSESIPKIPPGRSHVGPEQGRQMPVAPPGR